MRLESQECVKDVIVLSQVDYKVIESFMHDHIKICILFVKELPSCFPQSGHMISISQQERTGVLKFANTYYYILGVFLWGGVGG